MLRRSRGLVVVLSTVYATVSTAQRSSRVVSLADVPAGAPIRMLTQDGVEVRGHFRLGQADSVRLVIRCPSQDCATPYVSREYPTGIISTLSYNAGNQAHHGFLGGALVGVVAAGLWTLALPAATEVPKGQFFAIMSGLLGGTGAVIGLAAGASEQIWIGVQLRSP